MDKIFKLLKENNVKVKIENLEDRSSTKPAKKLLNFDIKNVINMSHYILKNEKIKPVTTKKLVDYLEADYILKSASWILIRRIEEKLTSALQQKIAFNSNLGEDFHLKISNFKNNFKGSKSQILDYKDKLFKLWHKIQIEQYNILKSDESLFEKYDYLHFSKYLSEISLTKKVNILKFLKDEEKELVMTKFNKKKDEKLIWIFSQLVYFRNFVAHHDILIPKKFNIINEENVEENVGIQTFLKYLYKLASPIETKKFKSFLKFNLKAESIFKKINLDLD